MGLSSCSFLWVLCFGLMGSFREGWRPRLRRVACARRSVFQGSEIAAVNPAAPIPTTSGSTSRSHAPSLPDSTVR